MHLESSVLVLVGHLGSFGGQFRAHFEVLYSRQGTKCNLCCIPGSNPIIESRLCAVFCVGFFLSTKKKRLGKKNIRFFGWGVCKKECIGRESNPGPNDGNVGFYH